MKESVARFLDYLSVERGLAKNTLSAYGSDLQRYLSFLRREKIGVLSDVTRNRIMDFLVKEKNRGLSPSSVSRELVAIRMLHRFLTEEGQMKEDVTVVIESPKLWKHLPECLTVAEVNALLASPNARKGQGIRDRALLEILYAAGLRASEASGLNLGHVNLNERTMRVFGKGGKERVVPFGKTSQKALERYLEAVRSKWVKANSCDALFVSRAGNRLSR